MMRRILAFGVGLVAAAAVAAAVLAAKQNPIEYEEVNPGVVPIEPEMVEIPGGTFRMGDPDGSPFERPVHEVTVSPFAIGRHEVTIREYARFVEATGRPDPPDPWFWEGQRVFRNRPDHPVIEISWTDAAAYCKWLSDRTGKHYHLPTEAQWEFAARGGLDGQPFPWGAERKPGMAHMMTPEKDGPVAVGQFPPNGYGLHDMAGNVNEFVADWFDEEYYANSSKVDPKGPSGLQAYLGLLNPTSSRSRAKGRCRTVRGGSYRATFHWDDKNADGRHETPARCGSREYVYQAPYTHFDLGFRVARD
jgi:sulfatase modifying factor 1